MTCKKILINVSSKFKKGKAILMLKYLNHHYSEKQPRPVTSSVGYKRILDLIGTFGRSNLCIVLKFYL